MPDCFLSTYLPVASTLLGAITGGGIGFLTHYNQEILRELAARDVQVNRTIAEVRNTAELYDRSSR